MIYLSDCYCPLPYADDWAKVQRGRCYASRRLLFLYLRSVGIATRVSTFRGFRSVLVGRLK